MSAAKGTISITALGAINLAPCSPTRLRKQAALLGRLAKQVRRYLQTQGPLTCTARANISLPTSRSRTRCGCKPLPEPPPPALTAAAVAAPAALLPNGDEACSCRAPASSAVTNSPGPDCSSPRPLRLTRPLRSPRPCAWPPRPATRPPSPPAPVPRSGSAFRASNKEGGGAELAPGSGGDAGTSARWARANAVSCSSRGGMDGNSRSAQRRRAAEATPSGSSRQLASALSRLTCPQWRCGRAGEAHSRRQHNTHTEPPAVREPHKHVLVCTQPQILSHVPAPTRTRFCARKSCSSSAARRSHGCNQPGWGL